MALAQKEMQEQNKESENIVQDKNTNTNGVMITVYVESLKTRPEDPIIKKRKPHSHFERPRVSGTQGYDRRAQLLAYSRQLRNEGSENVPSPTNQLQRKTISKKGIWLTQPVRICSCSSSRNPRRYERVASKESIERNKSQKKKSNGKKCPPVLISKVKNMLKALSCKEI